MSYVYSDCSVVQDNLFNMFITIRLHHYHHKTNPQEDYCTLRCLLREFHGSHSILDAIKYIEQIETPFLQQKYSNLLNIMKKYHPRQPKRLR